MTMQRESTRASTTRSEAPSRSNGVLKHRILAFVEAYALLIMVFVIGLIFALLPSTSEVFLSSANLRILVANQVVPAIVALAALLPLICNEFDLSVGATMGVVAIFAAALLSGGASIPVALVVSVAIGALVGLVNALLVTRAGVTGVVVTLGTSTLIAGVVAQKTGGQAVVGNIPESLLTFGADSLSGVPLVAWAFIGLALAVYFVLEHTPYGRQLDALGSNATAAKLVGLRIKLLIGSTYLLAGVLAAIAGLIYVARAGGADPSVGPPFTLTGLAAAFLSAAAVRPGKFNVWGAVVAVLFLAVLNNGLSLAGAPPHVTDYVNGGALIVGVALATYLWRRRST
ncbi:ABC transporter permease subunit [Nocardia sp. R7R-8]|uniref:ABC transporter permease subunit n=1 Tax=Nocardia sp. R7R-8 TaxID=3459304 RepID=UPI00403D7448